MLTFAEPYTMAILTAVIALAAGWVFLPRPAWIENMWPFSLLGKSASESTADKLKQVLEDTKTILNGAAASAATISALSPGTKATSDILSKVNDAIAIINKLDGMVKTVSPMVTSTTTASVIKPVMLFDMPDELPDNKAVIKKAKKLAVKALAKK
jgi:hypothetical protein